jgi:hypothetical protein
MTTLAQFFTYPWIKILFQEHLVQLTEGKLVSKKPFRAYVKEVYEGGQFLLLSDGFNECRAKLLPSAKTYLRDNYPSSCFQQGTITNYLISVCEYSFCTKLKDTYSISRASVSFFIELKLVKLIVAEAVDLKSLQLRKFKNKETGETTDYKRKTPNIADNADTMKFMKYWMHHKVKQNVSDNSRFDEFLPCKKVRKIMKAAYQSQGQKVLSEQEVIKMLGPKSLLSTEESVSTQGSVISPTKYNRSIPRPISVLKDNMTT